MKRRHLLAAVATVALTTTQLLGAAPASAATASARIVSRVNISPADPGVASLSAYYVCQPGPYAVRLWVSVKQSATGTFDRRLQQEFSSQVSAAWLESHPSSQVVCDGRYHLQTFTIDTQGPGFGALQRGVVWVQFCLFDGQNTFVNVYGWYPAS